MPVSDVALTVGQVVFVLMSVDKKTVLSPAQVVEEVVRKTIEGELVSYIVSFPGEKEPRLLSSIKGEVFATSEEAYNELVFRTTNQMKRMVDGAIAAAARAYPQAARPAPRMKDTTSVEVPKLARPTLDTFDPNPLPEDLAEAAEQEAQAVAGVTPPVDDGDITTITLPDGTVARARLVQ